MVSCSRSVAPLPDHPLSGIPIQLSYGVVVIVGRVERNRRDVAQCLHDTLSGAGTPLLGVVANGFKSGRLGGMDMGTPTTTRRAGARRLPPPPACRPAKRPPTARPRPTRLCPPPRPELRAVLSFAAGRGRRSAVRSICEHVFVWSPQSRQVVPGSSALSAGFRAAWSGMSPALSRPVSLVSGVGRPAVRGLWVPH